MGDMPKKYVKINGIMKLNPEYKEWKTSQNLAEAQAAGRPHAVPATTVLTSSQALPVVSSLDDYEKLNDDLGEQIPLAEATTATIEMMQEPDLASEAGMDADEMIDALGAMMAKHEVPIGLINKLMLLSEFRSLEFIIDDSGSMTLATDTVDPVTRRPLTRWAEAKQRLLEMIEVVAYVPFQQIGIEFLNRTDRVVLRREGRSPTEFLVHATGSVERVFRKNPHGSTPAYEKLRESMLRGQGSRIARYFFGDGQPNGGKRAIDKIVDLLVHRPNPEESPVTFISCTNDDEAVEWMKDAEEISPYCSESDDFRDEAKEVIRDQGVALPFSKGFHLVCQLVAVLCPDDLDAMDESVPFTKFTLDNLMGVVHNEESYRYYFDAFVKAQRSRKVEIDSRTGMPSELDSIRKAVQWDYQSFRSAPGVSKNLSQVVDLKRRLRGAGNPRG